MRNKVLFLTFVSASLPLTAFADSAQVNLVPKSGSSTSGTVTFERQGDELVISGTITGLTPGKHGFHVHEKGDCSSPDANSAGPHFNPTKASHGAPHDAARHAGDLGNLEADQAGVAKVNLRDKVLALNGETSVLGRSLIVHKDADDLKTQPTGASGDRVACGVIEAKKSS